MVNLLPRRTMSEEAQLTDTEDLQERLAEVQTLLARHKLVEELVHRQEGPRHDLVEDIVHKQHLKAL
jgi:magnesium transporter